MYYQFRVLLLVILVIYPGCTKPKTDENIPKKENIPAETSTKNKEDLNIAKDSVVEVITGDLKFGKTLCSKKLENKEDVEKIISKWENDILIAESVIETNCAMVEVTGDYEVKGDELILKCIETHKGVAKCLCRYKVIFSISNLEKKEYKISLMQMRI